MAVLVLMKKNVIHIVRKWMKQQNYQPNPDESRIIRNGYLTIAGFTALGVGFPSIVLFAPSMRQLVYNTKFKKWCFSTFCCLIGYVNYNSAHQTFMFNMLQLNDS
eukprot:295321_1